MFKLSANKISFAVSALLLCAASAQAQTEAASPLLASPASVAISYQLPTTGSPTDVPVAITIPSGSDAFVINPSTVPFWLTLNIMSGTATTSPTSLTFVANQTAATLGAGTYTANVTLAVSGFQNLTIPVTLSVVPVASTLSVLYGTTLLANNSTQTYNSGANIPALNWVYGSTPYPSIPLTILSTDSPVAFTAAGTVTSPAAPSNWIELSSTSGIAYNFGTGLTLNFLADVLNNASVGDTLTSTLTITYGSTPTTITINFTINVAQPYAALSATPLFPAYTPTQSSGTLKVVVTGSGFYAASGSTSATVVKISYPGSAGGGLVALSGLGGTGAVSLVNSTTMILTIPYQDAQSPAVGILTTPQAITISITSSVTIGGVLETPATTTLTVTTNPIVNSVTDAGALEEPAAGVTPKFAPYELISIFGNNFCPSGCVSGVVAAIGADSRYPASLTAGGASLTVAFNNQSGTLIANAYLIFANDTQINALVPSNIIGTGITGLQIVVSSGTNLSNVYTAAPLATNPGLFTTSATGQGQGAILLADYSVNSSTNPALVGDTVLIYASGLGIPTSTSASVTSTKAPVFPTSCFETSLYVTDEGLTSPATADGAVLVPTVWGTGNLPPCFAAKGWVTVSIGGQSATVTYAGWVAGSVTGLYQINVTVPKATTSTSAVSVPVIVTANGVAAQTGVTMYVKN
jgi:uncharacterized protein (TIGR03437 family)